MPKFLSLGNIEEASRHQKAYIVYMYVYIGRSVFN
jgi:hypothetical protein